MLMLRLGFGVSNLCKANRFRPTCLSFNKNMSKSANNDNDNETDKPIPYSTSNAATWKAEYSRVPPDERVWYTPYLVSGSVAIFMLYFCVLREENDIDELIYRPLPQTLVGIDKLFPHINFNKKPEYVRYYEEEKLKANSNGKKS